MENPEADASFLEFTNLQDFTAIDEKQISVDPISLRDSATKKLNPLPPSKPKLFSYSLPNSASSSPKTGLNMLRKKPRNLTQASSLPIHPLYRQQSVALANLERLREVHLRRSKSCGEGRASAPSEELEFWSRKNNNIIGHDSSHKRITRFDEDEAEENSIGAEAIDHREENFKCGALCLFLPGFAKAKPVKTKMHQPEIANLKESESVHSVSKRVSLEKFECGSWRSSAIMDENEDDIKDVSNLFYDLPMEMIRFSVSDTHSPVTAAFVFDKDPKGVLKKSSSRTITPKKSPDSSRHVRFSTSSPDSYPGSPKICVTPRIHKAREDFNAFLEAQIS